MNVSSSDHAEVTDAVTNSGADPVGAVSVVAVVTAVAGVDPQPTLDSITRQGLPPSEVRLIGAADTAAPRGVVLSGGLEEIVDGLDSSVDYVWILHGDALPRPDALGALVAEAERFEASLAGSKLLIAGTADTLESVGSATDVFGEPYSGLDEGEVDLEQYDVVRDVAFVSSVSMLVRRDLLRGMRGLDSAMAPVAAGLDLSQRVRVAGGRVIVVPSSEVFHERRCGRGDGGWREQSGRMRAMLKAYRPITLAWMVPFAFVVGVLDSLGSLLLGRWRLIPRYLLTWGWNAAHLPSTIGLRRNLARVRQVGDEELFRYQVRGSVRLRQVGAELSDRLLSVFDDDRPVARRATEVWNSATTWGILGALLLVLVGVRSVFLAGLPNVGYSLPLGDDPLASLTRLAGGWNASGLGSSDPVHPATGVSALVQLLLLGDGEVARSVLTLGSFVAGVIGSGRLASRLGVGGPWAYLAGVAALFGLPASYLADSGRWPALVGIGFLPVALVLVLGPAPGNRRQWWGTAGRAIVATALVTSFVPWLGLVPLLFAVVVRLLGRFPVRPLVALVGTSGALIGVPYALSRPEHVTAGVAMPVDLDLLPFAALTAAILLGMLAGSWRASALAGGLSFGGLTAARILGPDLQEATLAVAAVGLGVAVSAALVSRGKGRVLSTAAGAAGLILLVVSLSGLAGGRAGLEREAWGDDISFMAMTSEGAERALLIAPEPGLLPGESRSGPGFWYRLVESRGPTLDQAIQGSEDAGDVALREVVTDVASGALLSPGEALADFGVRWVVAVDQAAAGLAPALDAQVDLVPLPLAEGMAVYQNPVARSVAETVDGETWDRRGTGFAGPAGEHRVRLAIQGDARWVPDWQTQEWAGTVSAERGETHFGGVTLYRALVVAAGVVILAGVGLTAWGMRGRR